MRHLQQAFEDYREKGLVVVGVNCSDEREIAIDFLEENGATFPNVLDDSPEAKKTCFRDYQGEYGSAVPLSYVIDREGKIAAGWYGTHDRARVDAVLDRLGL